MLTLCSINGGCSTFRKVRFPHHFGGINKMVARNPPLMLHLSVSGNAKNKNHLHRLGICHPAQSNSD
jgi:hypothetical protein